MHNAHPPSSNIIHLVYQIRHILCLSFVRAHEPDLWPTDLKLTLWVSYSYLMQPVDQIRTFYALLFFFDSEGLPQQMGGQYDLQLKVGIKHSSPVVWFSWSVTMGLKWQTSVIADQSHGPTQSITHCKAQSHFKALHALVDYITGHTMWAHTYTHWEPCVYSITVYSQVHMYTSHLTPLLAI